MWLGLILFLGWGVVGKAKADGMVIYPPTKPVYETGQKAVIWWDGKKETLVLSTTFKGDAEDFAWVIPVPSKPEVTSGKDELFTSLDTLTRPKVQESYAPAYGGLQMIGDTVSRSPVTVIETKQVDIYDVTVLEATGGKALREWLTKNGYDYPTNRDFLLQYYINKNWYFVAAKVSTEALGYVGSTLKEGHANPLTITFDSAGIVYPLKISGPGSKYNEADKLAAFGFEQGVEGWYGGEVSGDTAFEGKKSYKVTARSYSYNYSYGTTPAVQTPVNQSVSRTITGLKKGTDYVVSVYINVPEKTEGEAKIRVSGAGVNEVSKVTDLSKVNDWQRIEVSFTPTYDGTVSIYLNMEKVADKTMVYWDAVQLEKGTTPTEFNGEVLPETTTNYLNQSMNVLLYVFADKKKTTTSFTTEYAGYVSAKDIQKLAYNDDGAPWVKTNKKMYLTKLNRYMSQAQMTEDVVIRDADNNDTVGGGQAGLGGGWFRTVVVLGIPLILEIGGVGYFWYSRSRRKDKKV
jgi:hypothetical protein